MKNIYFLFWSLFLPVVLTAQLSEINQVSVGPGYSNLTFYNLADASTTEIPHTDWDIAFGLGAQDLSVFVNEGVGLSQSEALPQVELYETISTDFSAIDTSGMNRVFNNELSWAAGAFNHVGVASDPFDFGWGSYNTTTHQVNGTRIFVIKMRNGVYKKLQIQSLISGIYSFIYANMDGTEEVVATIDKADFSGKSLAYYSLATNEAIDLEPAEWDLQFTRYSTTLDDGTGNILDYIVTGVLSNAGVEIAQVDGIDPETVAYTDYQESFTDSLDIIGHDWKQFDLETFSWAIPTDRVYFIKSASNELWKIQFLDFEGSSTGVSTFEKTFISELTNTAEALKNLNSYQVFPNPASNYVNIAFELTTEVRQANLQITNTLGQVIDFQNIGVQSGLNVKEIALDLPTGLYHITLYVGNDFITRPVLIK